MREARGAVWDEILLLLNDLDFQIETMDLAEE